MKPEFSEDAYYALYHYGSRVYGTVHPKSDWDYVAVDANTNSTGELIKGSVNIKLMGKEHFQKLLDNHNVTALECYFLETSLLCKDKVIIPPPEPWRFELDKSKLRSSFSEKASHSWVKAKKKFVSPYDRENELLRGKKSLFHCLRILGYGLQIAHCGQITLYDEYNHIFHKIMDNPSENWEDYEREWKPVYNEMASAFRKIAPK